MDPPVKLDSESQGISESMNLQEIPAGHGTFGLDMIRSKPFPWASKRGIRGAPSLAGLQYRTMKLWTEIQEFRTKASGFLIHYPGTASLEGYASHPALLLCFWSKMLDNPTIAPLETFHETSKIIQKTPKYVQKNPLPDLQEHLLRIFRVFPWFHHAFQQGSIRPIPAPNNSCPSSLGPQLER